MNQEMENVKVEVKDSQLVLTMDLDKTGTPSKSGKSIVIATTKGNQMVKAKNKEFMLGLNLYVKSGNAE